MNIKVQKIFIIDDDESVRRGLSLLLKTAGYLTESYDKASEFLQEVKYNGPGCIFLDIFLEGESGLEQLERIRNKYPSLPVIYISGQGDIPMSVEAIRKGALNFLEKPIQEDDLLASVREALLLSSMTVERLKETDRIRSLVNSLTPREKEVFECIITGLLNKQIAARLNIAEHTVKIHRGKITEKLGVKSVAEMVLMAERVRTS